MAANCSMNLTDRPRHAPGGLPVGPDATPGSARATPEPPAGYASVRFKKNRMMKSYLLIILATFALAECQSLQITSPPILVADRLYWFGSDGEGNQAYQICAKFYSQSQLADALRLDTTVGEYVDRLWTLADILVQVDLNANGNVATWMVSGPVPLILVYIDDLQQLYENNELMYDFSAREINARPTAFFE